MVVWTILLLASSHAKLRTQDASPNEPLKTAPQKDRVVESDFSDSPVVSPSDMDRYKPLSNSLGMPPSSASKFPIPSEANSVASPKPVEAPPPILRLLASNVIAIAGKNDTAWAIEIAIDSGSVTNEKILIVGMPAAATLSQGTLRSDGVWTLTPTELEGLRLSMPLQASSARVTVLLTTENGMEIARLNPTIDVRPQIDPSSPFGKNDLEDKALSLLTQGQTHLIDGDVVGARMFFKKAADAGDARASVALGMTFDPRLFASLKVRGMVPDVEAARHWYQRAIDLGSKDAYDRLEQLR